MKESMRVLANGLAAALVVWLCCSPALLAQCQLDWQSGTSISGPSGRVTSLANLPNGDLVVVGWFVEAGPLVANRVARWDGTQWHAFGTGVNQTVHDVAVAPNGDVYVAGEFTEAGGVPANGIARWDGSSWSALGDGFDDVVYRVEVLPSGAVLAGGSFQMSGTVSMPLLAQWDGASWAPVGSGLQGTKVDSIAVSPNGGFAVGGDILAAGGSPVSRIAIWDGTSWSGIPGLLLFVVTDLAFAPNGDLAIAAVVASNPIGYVLLWNGATVQTIASTATTVGPSSATELSYSVSGTLLAVSSPGGMAAHAFEWNGVVWTQVGGLIESWCTALLQRPSGALVVAGGLETPSSAAARALYRFDGAQWQDWGPSVAGPQALAEGLQGELYAATTSRSVAGSAVQQWGGAQWQPVGPALAGFAESLAVAPDGSLYAGGTLTLPGSSGADMAARWDGQQWTSISAGLLSWPSVIAVSGDGTPFAAPRFGIGPTVVSFDGAAWTGVGASLPGLAADLGFLPNGDLLACGEFYLTVGTRLACTRWDGSSWSAFGPPLPQYGVGRKVLVLPAGEVVMATVQVLDSQVLLGDGSSWTPLGPPFDGLIHDLDRLPNGDLLASGSFDQVGALPVDGLARWDGSAWSAVAASGGANGPILQVGRTGAGELHLAGDFTRIDGLPSAGVGRAVSSCPASTVSYGQGCNGPAGPVALAALDVPWVGASYRVRAFGMPPASVAVHALGLNSASVPLPPILPQSYPGCVLHTSGELLAFVLPSGNTAEPELQVPNDASLVGRTFYQQVVAVQLGVGGSGLLTVSSSNGLAATIGSL